MPPQENQDLVMANDVLKINGRGDDDTVETTCTDSCHSPTYRREYGSFDFEYHCYPESVFLVDKTPGAKTDGDNPRRDGLGTKTTSRPPSREHWYLRWKGSNAAMWLGHFTFIVGAIFYLKCALVDLAWERFSRVDHIFPDDILEADDDVAWTHWEKKNLDKTMGHVVDDMREHYWDYSTLYGMLGGAFFVVCGFADLLYYCEWVDVFMIFAGIAGVLSAVSDTTDMEGFWNFLSCHMYLLEAYVMIRRQRQDIDEMGETYDGHYFFLFSRMCFLGGCLIDVSFCHFCVYLPLAWFGLFLRYGINHGSLSRLT
ncbi:hypothetical protein ACHAW5_006118 [Stephanodiscus triporus]|uniref:Glycerophosphocholine acyltransferase 1 n=1 Tax=Stephanodiscus triporus TaxID=2934178 RepID=A0ABD3NTJ0_9STRA